MQIALIQLRACTAGESTTRTINVTTSLRHAALRIRSHGVSTFARTTIGETQRNGGVGGNVLASSAACEIDIAWNTIV
jgi:hypothetical protein